MIPSVLHAPAPGWTAEADVVVVGSGIAGLVTALRCRPHGRVLLVTKALLDAGSTRWAQGGIAAALAPDDSPEDHLADTLTAGVGLCDEDAVRALVTEGPDAVRGLIDLGAVFDEAAGGGIALTREGGHHRRRIAHAGGDATGAEISRALLAELKDSGVEVIEHALVLDLLKDAAGRAAGITLHVMGEGQPNGVGAVRARAVVLATGGLGQVFSATTNPEVSTGDGVALALRAGAEVADLEFVQFHPTVLWLGGGATGQQPLISEAVRGEGAHLVDHAGERFMVGRHELAELAPRDVVAKGIMNRMHETGAPCMFLDARHFGAAMWESRFPTILAACRHHGIDPVAEPIPVVPAAHHASGGVRTDLHGRTTVPGLYACGEVACTGVHGANRLASNSLLEGLVFAARIATALHTDLAAALAPAEPAPTADVSAVAAAGYVAAESAPAESAVAVSAAPGATVAASVDGVSGSDLAETTEPALAAGAAFTEAESAGASMAAGSAGAEPVEAGGASGDGWLVGAGVRGEIQRIMTSHVGVLRGAAGLERAVRELDGLTGGDAEPGVAAWEVTNLYTVASAIALAARRREETRGSHWREDFPERADGAWRGHLVTRLTGNALTTTYEPLEGKRS
ncbi:L-aspartate oxidase [Actinomadura sp. NAK00032]|uniref:L-aspartate oxidase n=1 Tax=Actinomadura sp. NAK00032 TaxID=2742128 RepID=UPI00158FEFA6|nr:L-aspartate oxidase [Actinomadura sp. NAK00032]QKW39506.1 L-aspartate oxidase [Actinomadura sp. NAK00032]